MKTTPLFPITARASVIVGRVTTITNQTSQKIIRTVGASAIRNRTKTRDMEAAKAIETTATKTTAGKAIEIIREQIKTTAIGIAGTPNEALRTVIKTIIKDGTMAGAEDIAAAIKAEVVAGVVEIMAMEKEGTEEEVTTVTEVVDARGRETSMTIVMVDDRKPEGMITDVQLGCAFDTKARIVS
mmetsp:Transcript_18683/g.43240  ORF Transcript_18683/g.43240 Transcript_18683/m.43240 type:complete len:184 (-) Transcript_18683:312-863(-)